MTEMISQVLFVLPWYDQVTSISNPWLLRFMDIGGFLGSLTAAITLNARIFNTGSLLSPKTVVLSGATSFLFAALCMVVNRTWLQHEWLSYISDGGFGFGNTLISATLLPCILSDLGPQKDQHQAMVYAGLQLAGGLAFSAVTVLSNLVLQGLAKHFMRTAGLPERTITKCLADFHECADGLSPQDRDVVQEAFLAASKWFSVVIFLATLLMAGALAFWMNDYDLEAEIKTGRGFDDETVTAER
jgi:hypothetical protein